MKTAIFYGSTNGNTERMAKRIRERMGGKEKITVFDVANLRDARVMLDYELLLWGSPTWGDGDLQEDWEKLYDRLDGVDLSKKTMAIFGLGDQDGYPHEFVDAMRILHDKALELGARMIGYWPDEVYLRGIHGDHRWVLLRPRPG